MEFVDGEDLAARLARGPLPLDEAIAIARQVADALEAAHEQGIIHRDLKPANLKVRPDGTVKVLDFGLARAVSAESSAAATVDAPLLPTFTSPALTRMGMIVGTAAYMAPEQARGRVVDRRADIWAFGALLYEMLAGRPAFAGDDVSITLANVLKEDVVWEALPDAVPPSIRRLLERDPKQRLRDIGEARIVLQDPAASTPDAGRPAPAPIPRWRRLAPWAAAAVGMLGVWVAVRPAPLPSQPTIRASISLPAGLTVPRRDRAVALSPDGTTLAVVLEESATARSQLYLRDLHDRGAARDRDRRGTRRQGARSRRSPLRRHDSAAATRAGEGARCHYKRHAHWTGALRVPLRLHQPRAFSRAVRMTRSRQREIRLAEVVADAQQRFPAETRDGVCAAVAEVERGRVASLSERHEGVNGRPPVGVTERDRGDVELLEQPRHEGTGVAAQPGAEQDAGFHECRRADTAPPRGCQSAYQLVVAGLLKDDGGQRGGVDDHRGSPGSDPRIAASSSGVRRRPRSASGTSGQISAARKRRISPERS
jgi:hypothetical protein